MTRRGFLVRTTATLTMVGLGSLARVIPASAIHRAAKTPDPWRVEKWIIKDFDGGRVSAVAVSVRNISTGVVMLNAIRLNDLPHHAPRAKSVNKAQRFLEVWMLHLNAGLAAPLSVDARLFR